MAKKLFTCNDVDLSYEQMLELKEAGHLNLGIDNLLALQISNGKQIAPKKSTASAAFHLWNWVGIGIFCYTIYLSFTSSWWWFILGAFGMRIIWNANKEANRENLLDAALMDKEFYEQIRDIGGWLYQIEEGEVKEYL